MKYELTFLYGNWQIHVVNQDGYRNQIGSALTFEECIRIAADHSGGFRQLKITLEVHQ